ncbi:glycosyltransferase family 2 protein [Pedobacter sp. SYSU D00535]|uniref:glycosyltransferase family 2 protein n=1 Tax=Pedobacter sp. SYSU D00535 TaxID=2810308 RepID=UPI001A970269|nr:glycosyltransferase family 2 protein [Pedobacter sp. SYSU D00535]
MNKVISVIIPAYNEEQNLPLLTEKLYRLFERLPYSLELIFINDGSRDKSLDVLKQLSNQYNNLFYIDFSRNFGQQNALRAGYDYSSGDAVICMDADLQNPPEVVEELIHKWEEGFEVVVCKRRGAVQNAGAFKESTSRAFYRLMSFLTDIPVEPNSPDFRLIDRKLVNVIKDLNEKDIFFRGLISWMGFKKAVVEYDHSVRLHGETKYSLQKMIKLASSGLTSFSVKPLHLAMYLGLIISSLSLLYIPYAFISYFRGETISGWASLIVTVAFFGGLQLLILGVIGMYLGKLFMQSKQRPEYIVRETNLRN